MRGFSNLCIRPEIDALEHERAQAQHGAADLLALHDVAGRLGAVEQVHHQRLDSLGAGRAEQLDLLAGQVLEAQDARAQGVVDVVVDVGDPIDELDDPALERRRRVWARVVPDAVAHLLREVQPLDPLDHTK